MCLRTAGILLVSLFLSASAACDGVGGRNVRLVGGSNNRTGRLEVCRNGQWKTMCSQRFNSQDASIVCRELGFSEQGARPINRGFKQANIGTWSVDVTCRGTEETILNCPTNSYREPQRSLCFHTSDVGVSCQPARSGDLRILGGRNTSSGRLEVFYNGTWGTVCQSYWSAKDAQVACRQLGFSASGPERVYMHLGIPLMHF